MDKVGKYLILGKLGQGGMGVVYKALDPLLDRVVALKTISTQLDAEPELRARFFREGRSAAHLSHKNIITVYDFGEDGGVAYLAMEYLEGEDLKAKISRRVNLSLGKKLGIVAEVCEGLAHAHSRQVIHRDIKPANVFVPKSGEAKILDFGLALMVAMDITRTGIRLGTPSYMSPEQVRGERVDHRTDIFSVGTLLYELLTLRKPFDEDSIAATIFKILQVEPEPPQAINPSIDPALGAIVLKALAKQREDRYQHIDELRAALLDLSSRLVTSDSRNDEEEPTIGTAPIEAAEAPADPARQGGKWGSAQDARHDGLKSAWTATLSITPPSKPFHRDRRDPTPHAGTVVAKVQQPPVHVSRLVRRRVVFSLGASLFVLTTLAAIWWPRHSGTVADGPGTVQPGVEMASSAHADSADDRNDPKHAGDTGRRTAEPAAAISSLSLNAGWHAAPGPAEARPQSAGRAAELDRSQAGPERAGILVRESRGATSEPDRLDGASTGHAGVPKAAPSSPEAGRLVTQPDADARKGAAQALGQMADSKQKAVAAGAPQMAGRSYEAASRLEEEARRLYEGGEFGQAAAKLYETSGLYASAALEAESEREARVRRDRSVEEERQAEAARREYEQERLAASQAEIQAASPQKYQEAVNLAASAQSRIERQDYGGAGKEFQAATTLMRETRTAASQGNSKRLPTSPEVISRESPATTLQADGEAITSVLGQYTAALQARDIARLKLVWPGLGGNQEDALRREFRNAREIHVQLRDVDIRISGDSAIATARRLYVLHTLDGQKLETENRTVMNLRKLGGSWSLDRIGFESLR